ncbi:hypothetical protein SprV_0100021100 [Sparganum proliferum]
MYNEAGCPNVGPTLPSSSFRASAEPVRQLLMGLGAAADKPERPVYACHTPPAQCFRTHAGPAPPYKRMRCVSVAPFLDYVSGGGGAAYSTPPHYVQTSRNRRTSNHFRSLANHPNLILFNKSELQRLHAFTN